jgi:molecular chaperone GrpE
VISFLTIHGGDRWHIMSDETRNSSAFDSSGDQTAPAQTGAEGAVDPNSEIELLREQLKAKEEEAKNHYERFLRQSADLENFKRRMLREKEEGQRFANEALIKDLLPIVDNLERAISHTGRSGNGESFVEGVEMILKGLLDALGKYGVAQISAVGQPFDPERHEAMAQVESAEYPPNTVLQEHQRGYLLNDRLLRPALVTVVKA